MTTRVLQKCGKSAVKSGVGRVFPNAAAACDVTVRNTQLHVLSNSVLYESQNIISFHSDFMPTDLI